VTTRVSAREVLHRRLATQRLLADRLPDPAAVVGLLAGVQSQEFGHALWSLGMRSAGTFADAQAAFDRGDFVRTHVLRPTWHFALPEDIGWLLEVTSARVHQLNGTMYRKLGLDPAALDRAAGVIVDALAGGVALTRTELGQRLGTTGMLLGYQVAYAETEGLVVSGPLRGAQHTYVRMDERVPPERRRTGDLGELAYRFFAGHGPASVRDLARWASLTQAQATAATEAAAPRLAEVTVTGEPLWFDPAAPEPPADVAYGALLLPLYDELTLSYPALGFPVADRHPHPAGEDLFVGSVVLGDANVGTWRRTLKGRSVRVEVALTPGLVPAEHEAVAESAGDLATFLDRKLDVAILVSPTGA
jgi:winged helix DNA-binding protein